NPALLNSIATRKSFPGPYTASLAGPASPCLEWLPGQSFHRLPELGKTMCLLCASLPQCRESLLDRNRCQKTCTDIVRHAQFLPDVLAILLVCRRWPERAQLPGFLPFWQSPSKPRMSLWISHHIL